MREFILVRVVRDTGCIALWALLGICALAFACGFAVYVFWRIPMMDSVVAEAASPDRRFVARIINSSEKSKPPESARVVLIDRSGTGWLGQAEERVISFKRPVIYDLYWLDDTTLAIEYDEYYEWSVLFDYYALYPKDSPPWHGVTVTLRRARPSSR